MYTYMCMFYTHYLPIKCSPKRVNVYMVLFGMLLFFPEGKKSPRANELHRNFHSSSHRHTT